MILCAALRQEWSLIKQPPPVSPAPKARNAAPAAIYGTGTQSES